MRQLDSLGITDETYLVFASDNGFHLGQHRLPSGKGSPDEADSRVPLFIRGPGLLPGMLVTARAGNVDLAPIFAALAGVLAPLNVDGRSLAPWLFQRAASPWRQAVLIDQWPRRRLGPPVHREEITPEAADAEAPDLEVVMRPTPHDRKSEFPGLERAPRMPEFHGVRTARYAYVKYKRGERELYDLQEDSYELHNISASAPRALLDSLGARLAGPRACVARP